MSRKKLPEKTDLRNGHPEIAISSIMHLTEDSQHKNIQAIQLHAILEEEPPQKPRPCQIPSSEQHFQSHGHMNQVRHLP